MDANGELLYIDCHPHVTQTNREETNTNKNEETITRTPTRRSTRGTLYQVATVTVVLLFSIILNFNLLTETFSFSVYKSIRTKLCCEF